MKQLNARATIFYRTFHLLTLGLVSILVGPLHAQNALTLAPTAILATSATFNGSVNPNGLNTTSWFQWGYTTNYGNITAVTNLGSDTSFTNFSFLVSGLTPATTYHFQTVATNAQGTNLGVDIAFTTPPGFANFPIADFPAVDTSAVAWGDYDNDGFLDFLLIGTTNGVSSGSLAQLWRNTGSGFTNVPILGLPGVLYGSIAWADYDRDGRLDFFITGTTNGNLGGLISQIWRNNEDGFNNVTSQIAPGLPSVDQGSVAWGDYNNDGRMDFILIGISSAGKVAQLWINNGTGFTNATPALAPTLSGVGFGSIASGDFDNDGLLDFLLTGELPNGQATTQIWRNTGNSFTNVTSAEAPGLPGVVFGSTTWGDYDSDGKLDFLVTGESSDGRVSQLWHNTGAGFTNIPISGLLDVRYGSTTWGDCDNDGKLDFLITGNFSGGALSEIWRNTGTEFTNSAAGLPQSFSFTGGSAALADFNNDSRLDVLVTGNQTGGGRVSALLESYGLPVAAPPEAPANLTSYATNGGLTVLDWSAANPATNVSYNLRVGTTPGGCDIVNPQSNTTNGFRRVPALGNAQLGTAARLHLAPGTYYWSVQAVGANLAGGPFAPEATLEVAPPPALNISTAGTNVMISWQSALPGWTLRETPSLSPATWTDSASGTNNPAILPIVAPQKFYQLYRP